MTTALGDLLAACDAEIGRRLPLATAYQTELASGRAAFHAAVVGARSRADCAVGTVPVVASLDAAPQSPLIDTARSCRSELLWTPTSRMSDGGTTAALAPLNEVVDLPDATVGLMLLAPYATYPLHRHPPQEMYLPITGQGRWRTSGRTDFRRLEPDELVYNHPNDVHSVIADDEPLLALYVLWD